MSDCAEEVTANSRHIMYCYGAMQGVFSFMKQIEVLQSQATCKWMYQSAVSRCQTAWRFYNNRFVYLPVSSPVRVLIRFDMHAAVRSIDRVKAQNFTFDIGPKI